MTQQDAYAISQSIWRRLHVVGGYQPYGWDWPTLRLLYPRMAQVLRQCYQVLSLPTDQ